jgi:hypothetical protein
MSREIDISTPLTQDDYTYLVSRGRNDLIERAHAAHGTSDADYADTASEETQAGPRPQAMLQGEARAARREQLLEELAALSDDVPDEDDEDEEDDRPYSEWTVPELDAQLRARELPTSGTKTDKVKRLEEDDAAE